MFAAAWLTLSCVIPVANGMVATTLPKLKAAVICPGFLNDAADFEPLAKALCARGIATAVAPFPLWHWIPQIGGRSVRPVLERIDHAVRHVAAMDDETLPKAVSSGTPLKVPPPDYGIGDVYTDFMTNPGGVAAVGGSASPDEYPIVEPRGRFQLPTSDPRGRVAVIGQVVQYVGPPGCGQIGCPCRKPAREPFHVAPVGKQGVFGKSAFHPQRVNETFDAFRVFV